MAEVVKLVQSTAGGTDRELDLKDGTSFEVKKVFLRTPPDNELWHSPDYGETGLVREQASDRPCQLDMNVFGSSATDEDGLQNNVVTLRRWLKNAQKAEMEDSIYPVYLQLQKNLATNAVKHRIKSGYIDDSLSHYIAERHQGKVQALHVTVNVILAPYGEWTSTISLSNYMFSTPHMMEDTIGGAPAGIADGWALAGTPDVSRRVDIGLIGGTSQRVITDDSTREGIYCDEITAADAPQFSSVVGYVWVYLASGDQVTIRLTDGGANLINEKELQLADAGSVSDKSATDDLGNTWYRVAVGGANDDAAGLRLWVERTLADASAVTTFYVDGAYLEVGTSSAPDAFMSAGNIDNRGDIQSTSQATENYLNYWDVWGIPGDAPALVKTRFNWKTTVASQNLMYVGKIADGPLLAADEIYWIDDDAFTQSAAQGVYTQPADGNRTEGQYRRFTDDGSTDGVGMITITLTDDDARSFAHNPKRILALVQTSSATTDIKALIWASSESNVVWQSGEGATRTLNLDAVNQWTYLDMGVFNLQDYFPLDTDDGSNQSVTFRMIFYTNFADATADVDAVLFLPTEDHILLVAPYGTDFNPNSIDTYITGKYEHAVNSDTDVRMSRQGALWTALPGNIMSRYIWAVQELDLGSMTVQGNHDPTIAAKIELTITPRTRHLLGTN